uniref:Potassium two pore domain channel subfamily K member 1 n=1 Tax=Meleagris gallopavo TaxID=9103 RepID=G3UPB5_MELGA
MEKAKEMSAKHLLIVKNTSWMSNVTRDGPMFSVCFILGYGHTVPLSDGGKAFCIIYSVIGIPFTLLFLTAVVQRIIVYVTRRPVLYFHIRWGFSKQIVAIIHAVVLGFITVSCFFFIPAAIFSVLEDDWNFLESFYFCFISLSTIGLGDYVPGEGYNQKFRELYKIGITAEKMICVLTHSLKDLSSHSCQVHVLGCHVFIWAPIRDPVIIM